MHFSGPIPSRTVTIPSGEAGINATLRFMVALVKLYKGHPLIRETARALVQSCADRDTDCEIAALQAFVRDQIRYTGDVSGQETLQTPVVTLGYQEFQPASGAGSSYDPGLWQPGGTASGDCDDKSTLLASLLCAVGIPGAFCAIGIDGGPFSHVLVIARVRRRTQVANVPLETIVPGAGPGWFPPDTTCTKLVHFA
jgi:transglutaminase-like putative cysteine protease